MAITIRSVKGSALTHSELDINFRSFYYSSSVTPSELILYTTASGDTGTVLSFNNAAGNNYQVQFKSGSADSGSLCRFSSSANFLFDYDQNHLKDMMFNDEALQILLKQYVKGDMGKKAIGEIKKMLVKRAL